MKSEFILKTGIDIGSKTIKIVTCFEDKKTGEISIAGGIREQSFGIINGQITDYNQALKSIQKAVQKMQKSLDLEIKKVSIGISAESLEYLQVKQKNTVAKSSNEVSALDLQKAKEDSIRSVQTNSPFEVLHTYLSYVYLDGKRVLGNPIGMIGHSIETIHTITTIPKKVLENFILIFEELNIEIVEICDNAYMSSVVLSKNSERNFGIGILDIGASKTTLSIFENNCPVFIEQFNFAGDALTKDIAMGSGLGIEESEELKKNLKKILIRQNAKKDHKKILNIVEARVEDFAFIIQKTLQKIENKSYIPNGIILSGGGANLYELKEMLKQKVSRPIVDGKNTLKQSSRDVLQDPVWANAYGLTFVEYENSNVLKQFFKKNNEFIKKIISKILP